MTIKTAQNQTPAVDRTDEPQLLTDRELDRVAGGIGDIVVTKRMDSTSPLLFQESLIGKSGKIDK
jgi:type VI protein secretion system component Hcp